MKQHLFYRVPFTRIAVILSIIAVISIGSCGIGAAVSSMSKGATTNSTVAMFFLVLGAAGFWLSILGLILLALFYVALYIVKEIASKD